MCEGKREWTKGVGDSKKAQELSVDKRVSKDTFRKPTVGMVLRVQIRDLEHRGMDVAVSEEIPEPQVLIVVHSSLLGTSPSDVPFLPVNSFSGVFFSLGGSCNFS